MLSADAAIDVDAHLGAMGPELAQFNYASYGYHTDREFESEVSWKGALEAFAEAYHFPFVHGDSVIGQNTLANTSVHDEFGMHHRMGFPFNWIVNLEADPSGSWDPPSANMGLIYWIYPNLILANSPVGVEIIDILPAGAPTRCTVKHSWMGKVPAINDEMRAAYDQVYESVHAAVRDEDFAMLPPMRAGRPPRPARSHDHRPQRNRRTTHDPGLRPGARRSAGMTPGGMMFSSVLNRVRPRQPRLILNPTPSVGETREAPFPSATPASWMEVPLAAVLGQDVVDVDADAADHRSRVRGGVDDALVQNGGRVDLTVRPRPGLPGPYVSGRA